VLYVTETVTGQGCPDALPCPAGQGRAKFFALIMPCLALQGRTGQNFLP